MWHTVDASVGHPVFGPRTNPCPRPPPWASLLSDIEAAATGDSRGTWCATKALAHLRGGRKTSRPLSSCRRFRRAVPPECPPPSPPTGAPDGLPNTAPRASLVSVATTMQRQTLSRSRARPRPCPSSATGTVARRGRVATRAKAPEPAGSCPALPYPNLPPPFCSRFVPIEEKKIGTDHVTQRKEKWGGGSRNYHCH